MKPSLKYLYRAVYRDNTVYDQNLDDISVVDSNKSCYHDLKLDQIKYFTLSNGLDSYTVDLTDGGISINGSNKIYLTHEQLTDFRLVYFRRVTMQLAENGSRHTIKYTLGYTATDTENRQVTHNIIIA